MKNLVSLNQKLAIAALFVCFYTTTIAQAKLVISGADINMANSVFLSRKDISLAANSNSASTIKIAGTMASAGSLNVTNGTVETNGTSTQTIPANMFQANVVKNLTVNNLSGVVMQGDVALTDVNNKTSAIRNVFRKTDNTYPTISLQLLLPSQLNTTESADGCKVFFAKEFPSGISAEDSLKSTNQNENLAILVQGQLLSIEGRQPVVAADTIFLKVWQLKQPNYYFRANLENFDPSVLCYLHDNYTQTNTVIKNFEETIIPFSINADTSSAASNRFSIMFETLATLPIEITNVNAYEKSKGISVDWSANTEINIKNYIVERSANGQQFSTIDSVKAKQNAALSNNYSSLDAAPFNGSNYYRIKAVDLSGSVKYSKVVKVSLTNSTNPAKILAVSINPRTIQIVTKNLKKAVYNVTMFNTAGSLFYKGTLNITGTETSNLLKLNNQLPAGIYQLHIESADEIHNISVLVK